MSAVAELGLRAHPDNSTETPNIQFPITAAKRDPSATMRALTWQSAKDVKVSEVPRVMITEPGDALVKVTMTCVCGSDLHIYKGEFAKVHKGDILGHEAVGVVEAVGPDVTKFRPGDRVAISAVISCGRCEFCQRQQYSLCDCTNPSKDMEKVYGHRTAALFGYSGLLGGYDGIQAEYARVPIADINLLKIPSEVPDEKAILLSDVLCTSMHAVTLGNVSAGQDVLVMGAGPIGLLCAMWCRYRGVNKLVIVDKEDYRLDLAARHCGATPVNFRNQDVIKTVQELIPGGPDVCIDAVGFRFAENWLHVVERMLSLETDTPEILNQCITLCKKGGTLVAIGDYIGYANHFAIGPLMEKSLTLTGGQLFCQKYWGEILELLRAGRIDPMFVVTHNLPFSEADRAYKMFFNHEDNSVKVLLHMN